MFTCFEIGLKSFVFVLGANSFAKKGVGIVSSILLSHNNR